VSDWWYIAIAYTAVWGGLAVYAIFMARRVTQARIVAQRLREMSEVETEMRLPEGATCDTPPVP
jgi:Flp pilus assembly protein protease CpaA